MKPDVLILTSPSKIGKREVKDFLWRLKNVLRDYTETNLDESEVEYHIYSAICDNNDVVDRAIELIDNFEKICE